MVFNKAVKTAKVRKRYILVDRAARLADDIIRERIQFEKTAVIYFSVYPSRGCIFHYRQQGPPPCYAAAENQKGLSLYPMV